MKIAIAYPPIISDKGVPLLSQNRQFQWFHRPTYIYPMIPAYAATMLQQQGHEVLWMDGIAEKWALESFIQRLCKEKPTLVLIEAKTPIIKQYWRTIDLIKRECGDLRIALCGDHVTALPEESMTNSKVDYVLTGGDYDFLLCTLVQHLEQGSDLRAGIYYRSGAGIHNTGKFELNHDLDTLPIINRELTRWQLYNRENGNFRSTPGTYTMVGRDCWWGKCRFCSWTTLYNRWRVQSPEKALNEIGHILNNYPIKEIFDDTGCFPAGNWLRTFCNGMIDRGYNRRVVMGCNMIPGVLTQEHYDLMAAANFRFVLFGLESADQETLNRIHKCGKAGDIENSMRMAKASGLQPHVTCMVGYPWETAEQARQTVALTRSLFEKGYIDTLQATIVIPYPGTPLFKECDEQGWLKTKDWDRYDMREPIMVTHMSDIEVMSLPRSIYRSFLSPRFIWRKLCEIRNLGDVEYYLRAGLRVFAHLLDFKTSNNHSII